MQQRRQRRMVYLSLFLGIGIVEVPYLVEEFNFRQDRTRILEFAVAARIELGGALNEDVFSDLLPELRSPYVFIRPDDTGLFFGWSRPLSSGFAIHRLTSDESTWIQD
ncbi:MAG: hypothetical protein ACI9K5_003586 [Gammaproteobacteria bacterium]|jgi:hypothetical protein